MNSPTSSADQSTNPSDVSNFILETKEVERDECVLDPELDILEAVKSQQDFASDDGEAESSDLPIMKPDKQWWFCISPHLHHRVDVSTLEFKEDKEIYLVHQNLQEELRDECLRKRLHLCQTGKGEYFWWPIKTKAVRELDTWNRSALKIVQMYPNRWLRVTSNQAMQRYDVKLPTKDRKPLSWRSDSMQELLKKTIQGRLITSMDHPAVRRLKDPDIEISESDI